MDKDDYDYYVQSVSEQLMLIFWISFSTIIIVGIMLSLAL